jgi:hypothetical protein
LVTTNLEKNDAPGSSIEAPLAEKLAALKRARFTPDGKDERVARSLGALRQEVAIHLSTDDWRQLVEDSDLEDQF